MQDTIKHIYTAHIDVVHGCQLRCVGCPNSIIQPKIKPMSEETFAKILGNMDVEEIHTLRLFNFGEPLLHKELSRLVALIPKQSFKTSIVEISTNGQKVYWDDFEEMMKLQVVNRLVVSCDGNGTPEDYERLRTPSKWGNLITFLDRARKLRDRWSPSTQLITRTVCEDMHARKRWEDTLVPRGWQPEFRQWMALPGAQYNMTNKPVQVPNDVCAFVAHHSEFDEHPWHGQINLLYVDYDGTIVPCCMHPRAGVLGDLTKEKYSEMMLGKARQGFIEHMRDHRTDMNVCNQCDVGPVRNMGRSVNASMDVKVID